MYVSVGKLIARSVVRAGALVTAYGIVVFNDIDPLAIIGSLSAIWTYAVVFVTAGAGYDLATQAWRKSWRFASLRDILLAVRSGTIIALALLLVVFILDRGEGLPRSVLLLTWLLDVGMFGGLLIIRRAAHERTLLDAFAPFLGRRRLEKTPLMLIGDMKSADAFLRDLHRSESQPYVAVGVIAPDARDVRQELRGTRVLGSFADIDALLADFAQGEVSRAVLFLDGAPAPADLDAEVLARLRAREVRLLKMNRLADLDVEGSALSLRELDLNELLSRPPIHLDRERVRSFITARRVLVTGAGGSIGSEICRQVASLSCAHLTMVDQSEFGLFKIDQEIGSAYPTLSRAARLCDVRDAARVQRCLAGETPEIVFHAAALKHVPLMEAHPSDSVLTNVFGSANVADAAVAVGADHFVLISTDKAVDPPNVMGATKRLAERVVYQRRSPQGPKISVVRFGNVLGSAGSVVPTFLEQIAKGGPVTLTHPDIERFFMTIPEAVQLVLHASARASEVEVGGSVLVLDMGKPVKIIDLARRLIELNGKTPGVDVDIRVTGLRPGEKLTEALFDVTEEPHECEPGLLEVIDRNATVRLADGDLKRLRASAAEGADQEVRALLFRLLEGVRAPQPDQVRRLRPLH